MVAGWATTGGIGSPSDERIPGLRFRVFGAFGAWDGDQRITVGGKQSIRVLTVLLAEAGRVVPISNLIDATWGENAPNTAAHQIRKIAADLRRRLPGGPELITTDGPGYRLDPAAVDLDLTRFHSHLATAAALAGSDPAAAVAQYAAALALWSPLLGGDGGDVIDALSELVHARYVTAAEEAMELRLALERPSGVIAELVDLVRQEPLVEGLRGQLIRALYLSGRQADALAQYDVVRRLLADELGVDPSPRLREIHAAVLANDDDALRPVAAGTPIPVPPFGDSPPLPFFASRTGAPVDEAGGLVTLPRRLSDFVGRQTEQDEVRGLLESASPSHEVVVVLHGLGGIGKTALALQLAHDLADRFPDGRLFLDMRGPGLDSGSASVGPALEQLFLAIGMAPEDIPAPVSARIDRWRMVSARRRMLLVVDDVVDADAVLPLLLTGPGSMTLITGRTRLGSIDNSFGIALGALSQADGLALLRHTVGIARVEDEPDAATEVVAACGGIPLAIRLVASQLRRRPEGSLAAFVEQLSVEGERLDELTIGGRSLASSFKLSIDALSPAGRTLLGMIAAIPWPGAALTRPATVAWSGRPAAEVGPALEELEDAHLVESRDASSLEMHALLRGFVLAGGVPDPIIGSLAQLWAFLYAGADAAALVLAPGRRPLDGSPVAGSVTIPRVATPAQARRWFAQHQRLLAAALTSPVDEDFVPFAIHTARAFSIHLLEAGQVGIGQEVCRAAAGAAHRIGDRSMERLCLNNLAVFLWRGGEPEAALTTLENALTIARAIGDRVGEATVLARLGAFNVDLGHLAAGISALDSALTVLGPGMDRERASALNSLSSAYVRQGRFEEATHAAAAALPLDEGQLNTGLSHLHLASAHEAQRDYANAREHLDRALAAYELIPGRDRLAVTHAHLAWILQELEDDAAAQASYRAATDALDTVSPARQAAIENLLGAADAAAQRLEAARERFDRALSFAGARRQGYEMALALDGLAEVSLRLGQTAESMEFSARADAEFERTGGVPMWFRGVP